MNKTTKVEIFKDGTDQGYLGTNQLWWFDPSFEHSFSIFDLDGFYADSYFKDDHVGPEVVKNYPSAVIEWGRIILGRDVKSILEVGCGGGWFTEAFINQGIDIIAIEGTKAGYNKCLDRGIPEKCLLKHDIRKPLSLNRKFDIALCTEVAEHIEPPFSSQLVMNLVHHSNLIWFSFEEPGTNEAHYHHSNEQPAIFWKNLYAFYEYGMEPLPAELSKALEGRGRFICYSLAEISLPEEISPFNWQYLSKQSYGIALGEGENKMMRIARLICPPIIWNVLSSLKRYLEKR
jgi:SAM-dependent methyltransferase